MKAIHTHTHTHTHMLTQSTNFRDKSTHELGNESSYSFIDQLRHYQILKNCLQMALQQGRIPQSNFWSSMLAHFWEMLVFGCGTTQIGILNVHQKMKSITANNYMLHCNSMQCSAQLVQRQAVWGHRVLELVTKCCGANMNSCYSIA